MRTTQSRCRSTDIVVAMEGHELKSGLNLVSESAHVHIVTLWEGVKRERLLVPIIETKSFCPFVITNCWRTHDTVRYRSLLRCSILEAMKHRT